jgi:hypothetical protein
VLSVTMSAPLIIDYAASDTMNAFFALILAGMGLGQASPYFSILSTAKGAAARVYQVGVRVTRALP